MRCSRCNGIGLIKMDPIRCDCVTTFCMKCENREGYIVKPWEECPECIGMGDIEIANQVLCRPSKITYLNKSLIDTKQILSEDNKKTEKTLKESSIKTLKVLKDDEKKNKN